MTNHLFVLGPGYSALPIMECAKAAGYIVTGTYRSVDKKEMLEQRGFNAVSFDTGQLPEKKGPMHVLITAAPTKAEDPSLPIWKTAFEQQGNIEGFYYLSSTNVYGNHDGEWVDETTTPTPSLDRGKHRLQAEQQWQHLANTCQTRCFIFRLAGIYGPRRNAIASLKNGKARCIIKPGQVFSRIHRDDIKNAAWAAMQGRHTGGVFNLADDLPCPPHEVIEAAANLMGINAPAHEHWETADLSPMARSFYMESKRVRNDKVKEELKVTLKYPTYQVGLQDLIKTESF